MPLLPRPAPRTARMPHAVPLRARLKTIAALVALAAAAGVVSYAYFSAHSSTAGAQSVNMPALAPGESPWARVGETSAMVTLWDRSSVIREDYLVKAWEIQDMKAPDPEGVMSRRYRAEYDCKHRMHRIGRMESYEGPMLTGKRLFEVDEMGYWRQAPRGSAFGQSLAMHCGMLPPAAEAEAEKEKAPWWAPFWPFK